MAENFSTTSEIHRTPGSPTDQTTKNNQVGSVQLYGVSIVSLTMDGKERLCLAQISSTLLKNFSYNEIHNRRVALGITCAQCTPVQLELLRRAGAMPVTSRRCGMITRREAERLCKSFLGDNSPPKLPENFAFDVCHDCAWSCRGAFLPSRYNSSRAKCIKCYYCGLFFSPNKFIFHSHRMPESRYIQPDAANFNSWRRHIRLCGSPPDDIAYAWEDVKAMFNGGSRKRPTLASANSHTVTCNSDDNSKDISGREESGSISSASDNSNPPTNSPSFMEPVVEDVENSSTATRVSKMQSLVEAVTQARSTLNTPKSDVSAFPATYPPRKKSRMDATNHVHNCKTNSNSNPAVSLNPSSIQPVLAMANAAINYGAAIQPYIPRIHPLYHALPSSATAVTTPANPTSKPGTFSHPYDANLIEHMWNNQRFFQQCLNPYAVNTYNATVPPSAAINQTNSPKGIADFTIAALTRKDGTSTTESSKNAEWPGNWPALPVNGQPPLFYQRLTDWQIISKFTNTSSPTVTAPKMSTLAHSFGVSIQELDDKNSPAALLNMSEHSSNEDEIIDVESEPV